MKYIIFDIIYMKYTMCMKYMIYTTTKFFEKSKKPQVLKIVEKILEFTTE